MFQLSVYCANMPVRSPALRAVASSLMRHCNPCSEGARLSPVVLMALCALRRYRLSKACASS